MPEKKVGRPTSNPRNHRIGIRLDDATMDILERYCKQESVSKTEAALRGIRKLESDLKK